MAIINTKSNNFSRDISSVDSSTREGGTSYGRDHGIGTSTSTGRVDPFDVKNSSAYQVAYSLFVDLPDQSWFNRLQAIASDPRTPADTLGDSFGITNNAETNRANVYNSQINSINELISQYYEHVNSLPVTQKQQFADAGVNYSLMGNQTGSSYGTAQQGLSTSSTPSPSSLDFITQAVGTITSVVGAVANTYKAFSEVSINRGKLSHSFLSLDQDKDKFLTAFTEQLSSQGFDLTDLKFEDFDDVRDFFASNIGDPVTQSRLTKALIDNTNASVDWAPYQHLFSDPETGDLLLDPNKLFTNAFDVSNRDELDSIMEDFCAYNLQIRMFDSIYKRNMSEFNSIYSEYLDPNDEATAFNVANAREISQGKYESAVSDIKSSFVRTFADKYKKTNNPGAKYALMEILFSMDLDDQAFAEMVNLLGSPTAVKITNESASLLGEFASKFIGGKSLKGVVKNK